MLGELTGVGYADGTSVGYAYDGNGNVLSMSDSTGTTTFGVDALNRCTKKNLPNSQAVTYTYDGAGNLLTKTDSGGTITYGYNADNAVTSVTDRNNAQTTLGYDSNGNNTSIAFPNGVTESLAYNGMGQLTSIAAKNGSNATLTSYTYSYSNPANNQPGDLPYSVTDASGRTTNYTYDAANELTQALQKDSGGSTLASYTYAYDANGNTTSQNLNGASSTFAYNGASELIQSSGSVSKTYSYDANGNMTAAGGVSLTYNAADQTTGITPSGGSVISMQYTGQGQGERVAAGSNSYQYDAAGLSLQSTGSGNTYFTTLPDGGVISETITSSSYAGTYYYLNDGQGSVAGLTDSSGSLVDQYAYDPNGNVTTSSGSVPNPFTYNGWQYDASAGLYYTGSGYYDPTTAIATCRDRGWVDPGEDGCGHEDEPDPCQYRPWLRCGWWSHTFCASKNPTPLGPKCAGYSITVTFAVEFTSGGVKMLPGYPICGSRDYGSHASVKCTAAPLHGGRDGLTVFAHVVAKENMSINLGFGNVGAGLSFSVGPDYYIVIVVPPYPTLQEPKPYIIG